MPLQRQHVDLIPKQDQIEDDKTAPVGIVVLAQNATRAKTREYRRRSGSTALGTSGTPAGAGSLPPVWQLATYKDALLALPKTSANSNQKMPWVWSPTANKWVAPNNADGYAVHSELQAVITSARHSIYAGDYLATSGPPEFVPVTGIPVSPDIAVVPGTRLAVAVWQNQGGSAATFTELIYDLDTLRTIARRQVNGDHVHVEASGSAATVVYVSGTTSILCRDWTSTSAPTGTPTRTATLSTTIASGRHLDTTTTTVAGKIAIACYKPGASTIDLALYNNAAGTFTSTGVTADANLSIGFLRDFAGNGNIYLVTAGTTDGVKLYIRDQATLGSVSSAVLSTNADTAKANVHNITGYTLPGITHDWVCLWDVDSAGVASSLDFGAALGDRVPYDAQIMCVTQFGGSIQAPVVWLLSVSLRSKAFMVGTDYFVLTAYGSIYQPSYFLMRPGPGGFPDLTARGPVTKILRLRGAGMTETKAGLTNVVATAGQYVLSVPRVDEARSIGGPNGATDAGSGPEPVPVQSVGVDVVTLSVDSANVGHAVEFADSLMVPGGQVFAFDGQSLGELNVPIYPDALTWAAIVSAGEMAVSSDPAPAGKGDGSVPTQYAYTAVYRRIDGQGRVHRSTPAVPIIAALQDNPPGVPVKGGTPATQRAVTLTIPCLRIFHGRQVDSTQDVTVEVYRTTLNGTTFYLRSEIQNDPSACFVIFNDYLSDADVKLTSCTQLYCALSPPGATPQLGALEHHTPPQLKCMVEHRGRLFGISADDPREIWFSEPIAPSIGPIFNEALTLRLDDDLGECTALASMDDKLIMFKRQVIYVLLGDGPDNTGTGEYPTPHQVGRGVGTVISHSVVTTPDGTWFQSPKGIYLLDRGLNPQMAGAPVQTSMGTATVVDVVHVDAQNQVRHYLDSGICLVWDYFFKEWYVWDGQTTYGACKWGAEVVQIDPNNNAGVWASDSTEYTDAGVGYQFRITSAWMALGGVSAYQRIYEISAVGEYVASHRVRMSVAYDYIETIAETREVTPNAAAPWQLRMQPARQKCHAIKVSIWDTQGNAILGGGDILPVTNTYKLSGLGLVAAVKAPGGKVPAGQRFGPITNTGGL